MTNLEIAYEIITRLNRLMQDPIVADSIRRLCLEGRVNVPEHVADHPTIQVLPLSDGIEKYYHLGFLGLLNGLVGVQPDISYRYIAVEDEAWFTVLANKVDVDSVAKNPRGFGGVMLSVTGKVTGRRGYGSAEKVILRGKSHSLTCQLSHSELGPELPEIRPVSKDDPQEVTLYGCLESQDEGSVLRVYRKYPGRAEFPSVP